MKIGVISVHPRNDKSRFWKFSPLLILNLIIILIWQVIVSVEEN